MQQLTIHEQVDKDHRLELLGKRRTLWGKLEQAIHSSNLSWFAHISNTCQGQETVGPAVSPLPPCWQEDSVQTVQIYCPAPVRLLCLCVGPTSGYQDPKTGGSTEIHCQVGHWPLIIRLSGPNPTHELALPLATCQKRQKLLLCRRILLGGSIIPSSISTPHPHP